jgi:hypothetical protein
MTEAVNMLQNTSERLQKENKVSKTNTRTNNTLLL